jgi:hypothetical protein
MQLHHHNQIAHVAFTRRDGKWRAPDSTAYYEHVRAAGQIASVHAEAALMRRFGLDWVMRPDGMGFGIEGIGADLMDVFSHRRDAINDKLAGELVPGFQAEYGRAPNQRELASLMDKANLRTRRGKDGMTDWDAAAGAGRPKPRSGPAWISRRCTGVCHAWSATVPRRVTQARISRGMTSRGRRRRRWRSARGRTPSGRAPT